MIRPRQHNGKGHETYLSTQHHSSQAHPRFPCPHEHQGRPQDHQRTPCQGPQETECLSQEKSWPADGDQGPLRIPASIKPEGFPRQLRLLSRGDFQRVFNDTRCKSADDRLLILATPNGRSYPRLGLAISKRNIKTAVGRNRVKRLVRESFRRNRERLAGLDIVVLSRHATHDSGNQSLLHSLNRHWRRLAKRCANSSSS